MPGHDLIVIGASAGGVEVLKQLVDLIPADLPASLFVVLHVPSNGTSALPKILTKWSPLPAYHPRDGEQLLYGRIYIGPPDSHLLIKPGYIRLARGPKENGFRPAIDPLFRTAARVYGPRVVDVILSGTLDDGTAGMIAIKQRGGITIAQDPNEAMYAGMPQSAIENAEVDYVLPVSEIVSTLVRLANEEVEGGGEPVSDDMEIETDISELEFDALHIDKRPGTPSRFTCPECNGGFDLIHTLRDMEAGRDHKIPAIALTAYADEENRQRLLSEGFQMHLAKPVRLNDLASGVIRLVAGRQ